jgi:hypothetical protein
VPAGQPVAVLVRVVALFLGFHVGAFRVAQLEYRATSERFSKIVRRWLVK